MTLCDDAELWRRLSANGYQTFQNQFSLEAGEGAILGVVDGLVASTRGSYKKDGLSFRLEDAGRNDFLSGLQEKEAVILRLHAACTEKEAATQRIHAACTEKEAVILRLHAACTDLQDQLQEKEDSYSALTRRLYGPLKISCRRRKQLFCACTPLGRPRAGPGNLHRTISGVSA